MINYILNLIISGKDTVMVGCKGFNTALQKKHINKSLILNNEKKIKNTLMYGYHSYVYILILYIVINKIFTKKFFTERTFIFLCLLIVCEMFNTSIELIADFVHPKFNSKIGDIKDVSAGACLLVWIFFLLYVIFFYKS